MRRFAGLDAFADVMPDESTILRFRHLPERHNLSEVIFAEIGELLAEKGLNLKRGSLVDATLGVINAAITDKISAGLEQGDQEILIVAKSPKMNSTGKLNLQGMKCVKQKINFMDEK